MKDGQDIKDELSAEEKALNTRERAFVTFYLKTLNKSKAAKMSGTEDKYSRQTGYIMYNRPHVKAVIEKALESNGIGVMETVHLVSNAAKANILDYFVDVVREETRRIKVPLRKVIQRLEKEIKIKRKFIERKGYVGDELSNAMLKISWLEDAILMHEIELEEDPRAFIIENGETRLVKVKELDINALVADKDIAQAKKVKYTMAGIEVELVDPAAAQDKILRINGAYKEDNEQKGINLDVHVSEEEAIAIKKALDNEY